MTSGSGTPRASQLSVTDDPIRGVMTSDPEWGSGSRMGGATAGETIDKRVREMIKI